MPRAYCECWSHLVVAHYSPAAPFLLLLLLCSGLTAVCANQVVCWSASKCLHCNLMKANSHKGGKLLPGNSTPQAFCFIFLFSPVGPHSLTTPSPQNKCSYSLRVQSITTAKTSSKKLRWGFTGERPRRFVRTTGTQWKIGAIKDEKVNDKKTHQGQNLGKKITNVRISIHITIHVTFGEQILLFHLNAY